MTPFTALLIGDQSLTRACGERWLARGHRLTAVVTDSADVEAWARAQGLPVVAPGAGLADRLSGRGADWILSVANLRVLPTPVLALAARGSVNFHDGPLPRHAGLNAPVWALLEGEAAHGITWHLIGDGIDDGDILEQRLFDIAPDETAFSLNAACFAAGVDSFPALITALETGMPGRRGQDAGGRTLHLRDDRPAAFGRIDFAKSAEAVVRHVRALDHGGTWNPLATAKVMADGHLLHVGGAEVVAGGGAPGTVLQATGNTLVVACGTGAVRLTGLVDGTGRAVDCPALEVARLALPDARDVARLAFAAAGIARAEPAMRRALQALEPLDWPMSGGAILRHPLTLPDGSDPGLTLAHLALAALRLAGQGAGDLALATATDAEGHASSWAPLRIAACGSVAEATVRTLAALGEARARGGFAADLPLRDPALRGIAVPPVALSDRDEALAGAQVTLTPDAVHAGGDGAALALRLSHLLSAMATDPEQDIATLPLVTPSEAAALAAWNATATDFDPDLCVHRAFEAQVVRTPDAPALAFENEALSYADLDERANRVAQVLVAMGVAPGTLVGLCTARGIDMVAGALAILKAGGAYVPMDPAYPPDRLAFFAADSAAPVIVTQGALAGGLAGGAAQLLCLDTDPRIMAATGTTPAVPVTGGDLAYMIYTSGSTGRPKGVMVEHRNVANFFTGMDAVIGPTPPGVWLAVTSLSFDISVLELFWTLARGFKVVIAGDESRRMAVDARVSASPAVSARGMEFSLYYWGSDDGTGPGKYDLLLEGAKFADTHGFTAVWTPERHFHAFGGLYPNPAVTGAAVAAVTRNLAVRAGSCVAPLHHPARIAEEWAVIDNLTGGRSGLAMAAGWQPDDFVLRPQNTPPANRKALFDTIDQVRRLWRGEAVDFPTATGTHAVVTQPRPLSKELAVWVTTAGNPETWREAGAIGANVLTHLLGQTVDEVACKIAIYHDALREAGHDPAAHRVTLMLHACLADSREAARNLARGPMVAYLRSAAGLIKHYAWAFPAFKKPQGVADPAGIDLSALDAAEMDAILEFAFERYFEESGLFGTVEDAVARVEALKRIGVDEVACLIDYGIAADAVLAGLRPLAEVLRRANAGGPADHSIAAGILRHGVMHLQCTPSMARMLAADASTRAALAGVGTLMLGGEALPGALVADLRRATGARILNMYGPTETTIWSSTTVADDTSAVCGIGAPIANTALHVLDASGAQVPPGMEGELWIGGAGVARGYWQRPDLTAERFRPDPFAGGQVFGERARMYRTGDLVRRRPDGTLDFLGRADAQVKVRGYRIEPGEIEALLEAQPGVTQAVVLARENQPGDVRLVAYTTGTATEGALRPVVEAALPAHMRPAHYLRVEAFPLTPNRKIDRKALPSPQTGGAALPGVVTAAAMPVTGIAACIAGVWQRILGVGTVGPRDNFFALGGHSLLAVQAHREIWAALAALPSAGRVALSITDIFRFPTLGALAAHLEGQGAALPPVAPTLPTHERADARADAMERRRAMRAARTG